MKNSVKIAIFGAGVAGLSAAVELVDRGHTVEIYEKRNVKKIFKKVGL